MLDLSCSFNWNYSDTWTNLYLLDNLEGWSEGTQHELRTLPFYIDYMYTLAPANSYRSRQTINTSAFEPFFVWRTGTDKFVWKGQLAILCQYKIAVSLIDEIMLIPHLQNKMYC